MNTTLADDLQRILSAAPYPHFSDQEMLRRRKAMLDLAAEQDCTNILVYGSNRSGSAVQWLTGWPVTVEAALLMTPGERDALFVQFYNHVPNATQLAPRADVHWGGARTTETLLDHLKSVSSSKKCLGLVGALPYRDYLAIAADFAVKDLTAEYRQLRMLKSREELDWYRIGAWLSDRAIDALQREVRPGMSEWDLADIVKHSYVPMGGTTLIHFFGITSMAAPDKCVPSQYLSHRSVAVGDVITTEISASFWRYPGQVLRTFTVGAEPSPLYEELHAVAGTVFDEVFRRLKPGVSAAELMDATKPIEEAGFTIYDDLVHGFDGDYLPPVLGSASRSIHPVPDLVLEAGMTLVIQPNVITRDGRAGVQTGEFVVVTETGAESLHSSPRGLLRIPVSTA